MAEVIEATATEIVPAEPEPSHNLSLFGTTDPVEVVEAATRVADALAAVIRAKGLYSVIQNKAHVRVEGWQLLGSMLGVTAICTATEEVEGGYLATVEARTADGRVVGRADALCTKHERRGPWKSADDYARLSMAQTRATAKALKGPLGFVISLAGYQTTPAEEMTFAEPETSAAPDSAAENGASLGGDGGPVAEGSSSPSAELPPARVEGIVTAIKALGLPYKEINVLLGAAGIDALRAYSAKALLERLGSLSDEQATALERQLLGVEQSEATDG